DALPVLVALDATVHLRSKRGARLVPFTQFMTGPKKNVRAKDELVTAVEWDDAGPAQVFMKVGTRNAMVIAVAGLAFIADRAPSRASRELPDARRPHGERREARRRSPRRRVAPHVPARGARAPRQQERVRAGRVRVVLGDARWRARLQLPRARGSVRGQEGRDG